MKKNGTAMSKGRIKAIAADVVNGEDSITDICKRHKVSPSSFYRHLNGERGGGTLKKYIEEQSRMVLDAVPDAVALVRNTIESSLDAPVIKELERDANQRKLNIALRKVAQEAAEGVLRTAGMLPSTSQAQQVQNIIIGTSETISPIIAKILGIKDDSQEVDITPDEIFGKDEAVNV